MNWEQLDAVIQNEKDKLRASDYEKWKHDALKLAKIL